MRLIGRNYDLIGQILKVFENKRKNKKEKKYSVKGIADEQECSKSVGREGWQTDLRNNEVDGHFLARKKIEDLGDW